MEEKKCKHNCNHSPINIISGNYNVPQGFIEEYDVQCDNCKEIIGHWAYGSFDIDYMIDFELKGFNWVKALFKYRIKPKIWGVFNGKRKI